MSLPLWRKTASATVAIRCLSGKSGFSNRLAGVNSRAERVRAKQFFAVNTCMPRYTATVDIGCLKPLAYTRTGVMRPDMTDVGEGDCIKLSMK